MPKIDDRNRIYLPKNFSEKVNTDFNATLNLYAKGQILFLDNPSPANYHIPSLGKISINRNKRFMIPQLARSIFNLNVGDEVSFYIYRGRLAFKRSFSKTK